MLDLVHLRLYLAIMYRSLAPRFAAVHCDPALAAGAALIRLGVELFVEWVTVILTDTREAEARYKRRIEKTVRRKYVGRRCNRLRTEIALVWLPLVVLSRVYPKPVRRLLWPLVLATLVGPYAADVGTYCLVMVGKIRLSKGIDNAKTRFAETLDAVDASTLIKKIKADRHNGRHGYPPEAMWRAYFASFILGMPSTNAPGTSKTTRPFGKPADSARRYRTAPRSIGSSAAWTVTPTLLKPVLHL